MLQQTHFKRPPSCASVKSSVNRSARREFLEATGFGSASTLSAREITVDDDAFRVGFAAKANRAKFKPGSSSSSFSRESLNIAESLRMASVYFFLTDCGSKEDLTPSVRTGANSDTSVTETPRFRAGELLRDTECTDAAVILSSAK